MEMFLLTGQCPSVIAMHGLKGKRLLFRTEADTDE
jgi:hypothetical protein